MKRLSASVMVLVLLLPAPTRAQSVKPADIVGTWVNASGPYSVPDFVKDENLLAWMADSLEQNPGGKAYIPILVMQSKKFAFAMNKDYMKDKSNLKFSAWDSLTGDTIYFGKGETYRLTLDGKRLKLIPIDLAPLGGTHGGFYRRIDLPKPTTPSRSRSAAKPRKK